MDEKTILIELEHVLLFLGTILLGIFKNDISSFITGLTTIKAQKKLIGRRIKIASPSGEWEDATIIEFQAKNPLLKTPCVIIEINDDDSKKHIEKFSIKNWKQQRIRIIEE